VSSPAPVRLRAAIEPVVRAVGLDLEEVTVTPAGRRRMVRVVVDRDGGLTLDDVAETSRVVSDALDADDLMGAAPYVLEVSTPGVDRLLTAPRHWRRATGRLVRATLVAGGEIVARVLQADDEGVEVELPGGRRRLAYSQVSRAQVQVEFSRPADEDAEGED